MGDQMPKAAQIVGILGAAFLSGEDIPSQRLARTCNTNKSTSGFIACFSRAGVPTLSLAPVDILVHEFKVMYNIGKSSSPPIAVVVALCMGFSAYQARSDPRLIGGLVSPFALYVAAALCIPSIVPYTGLYMHPTVNKKLLDMGAMAEKGATAMELGTGEKEIREMFSRWKGMNYVRAALVGGGALLAAVAALG
ncbi:hypothetical protein MMC19_000977 [Ptychographa xylographoides]|nr:hypothetical protein [Ptychographa xylographoides]